MKDNRRMASRQIGSRQMSLESQFFRAGTRQTGVQVEIHGSGTQGSEAHGPGRQVKTAIVQTDSVQTEGAEGLCVETDRAQANRELASRKTGSKQDPGWPCKAFNRHLLLIGTSLLKGYISLYRGI